MSKTTEQTEKDTSQDDDVDLSVSSHWYSSDSLSSKRNINHSKLKKQDNITEQDAINKYDQIKLDELSHKIKRARYSDYNVEKEKLDDAEKTETKIPVDDQSTKSIQSLLRSQSLEGSKQSTPDITTRKLSLKDSSTEQPITNLESSTQNRSWFKPPIPSTSKTASATTSIRNESIDEIKENLEKSRQFRSASLGKEGIFQFTQKSLSNSLQALVSGKLNENSFNTLERALNIIRAYDLQNLEPDNSIYELLDAIDDQDFKKAVPLANAFLDDEYKKLLSSIDLLEETNKEIEELTVNQNEDGNLQVPSDQKEVKKQSSFEKQQLDLQQLEESVDIDELIDLIPDEQSILSKKFRESDLVLLRKLRSIEEDDSPEDQNKESSISLSDKLTLDLNNNLTSFELSEYPESQSIILDQSKPSRSPISEISTPGILPKFEFRQNAAIQTEKSFLLTQRMHTINAIVNEISRPDFVDDALCTSPTESSPTYSCSDSQSQTCNCSECQQLNVDENNNQPPANADNASLLSYETCPSLVTSCSNEYCKRRQSLQSELFFTCSEGSMSRCSTCTSLNSLDNNRIVIDRNNIEQNQSSDERPISVCESSTSTITSRSTLDSVEAATAAVETGLIALIAGELTLLLGELTLKFEIGKRLDKEFESTTTSDSEAAKLSINEQCEQLIREHLAPIYEIYGKELPENFISQLIGDHAEKDGNYVLTEKDIQPEQLALKTQEMLRNAMPIKKGSNKKKLHQLELTPELFSPEESEGVWVQTYTSSSGTSKKEIETQTSEEDFSEDNSDSVLFGKYLMMDNEKLLKNKKPLLLDVDEFVNYLIDYCSNAANENEPTNSTANLKPALNVKDVMIKLRKNPKFINFLSRINGQLKANADNEIITNHDLLLEMVTDQCKDELINILKDVIKKSDLCEDILKDSDYVGEFNPTLLDSIPEEDSDELISRGSTLNSKQISIYKEQQKAVEKWLAASLDNLAAYAQQNIPADSLLTTAKITDSQGTLLPDSKEELNQAIAETEQSLRLLIEDQQVPVDLNDQMIQQPIETKEKETLIKMPIITQEAILVTENPTIQVEMPKEDKNLSAVENENQLISGESNMEKIQKSLINIIDQNKIEPTEEQSSLESATEKQAAKNVESKEEPVKTRCLEVLNTFTARLAVSLDEGTDDEEKSGLKKLEKTHSLPEDEFSKKTLNDLVEIKNQPNMHLTNLDLSKIQEQTDGFIQEEVLNNLIKDPKRPKLQYQFASEEDLYPNEDQNVDDFEKENIDEMVASFENDDQLQDSIFDNLNLMETIEESFEDDNNSQTNVQLQQNQNLIEIQQQKIDDYEQQIIEQQAQIYENELQFGEQESALMSAMQQQQQIFANELMELQREFANNYMQQEQYFEDLQMINEENLEHKLEQLLNQAQELNIPEEQSENVLSDPNLSQLESLIEKLTNDHLEDLSVSKTKLNQKSLSDSLSEEKEKSTSSDTSVVTEILNESLPTKSNAQHPALEPEKFLESSIKLDNIITYADVPPEILPEKVFEQKLEAIDQNKEDVNLNDLKDRKKNLKKAENQISGYDIRDVAKAAFDIQNEKELDDITDQLMIDETRKSVDFDDLDENLEMIENIAKVLEELVTEASPSQSNKQKPISQIKYIKPALMEEIAKTLNDLLTEAKQVLGDNQITLSSQKLNQNSKKEVIESITNTLEDLLKIDDLTDEQFETPKNVRKCLIQNIAKSLESLLTDQQIEPHSAFSFKNQQRSFDQEPKLNMIITRSLENLLTLSNPELFSNQKLKKSKKPGILESITRTLENLFTKSQVEMDKEMPFQCTCKITLDNKKLDYKSPPEQQTSKDDKNSDFMDKFVQKLENLIDESDKVSLKSTDSRSDQKPIAPKRIKKLKVSSSNQDLSSQNEADQISMITVMSPEICEKKSVILDDPQVEMVIEKLSDSLATIDRTDSSKEIPKTQLKEEELDIEQMKNEKLDDLDQIDIVKLEQKVINDNLVISEFNQKTTFDHTSEQVSMDSDLLKTDFKNAEPIHLKSDQKELDRKESNQKESDQKESDQKKSESKILSTQKKMTLSKTAYTQNDNLVDEKPESIISIQSDHHKSLEEQKQPEIVSIDKRSDPVKTDFVKSSNLKKEDKPLVVLSIIKKVDLFKTDYHYVPATKQTDDEQIEMEKIQNEKTPDKKLKLRMPIHRKESILIRQNQIEEDQQEDISDSFDVKLIASDDEPLTPESQALTLKRKSISEQKSNQIIELGDEFNLTGNEENRKFSVQSDQSEYAEASEDLINQVDDEKLRESANVVRKKSVRFHSPDIVDVRLFTPGSSQEIEFYDADDDDVNFNQDAIQDLIDGGLENLKKDGENNFDRESINTLVEKKPENEKRKGSITGEMDVEIPPEMIELLKRPFSQLTDKEKMKLKKLKDKYDEKVRKQKEKQESKMRKEEEKVRKKAEEEEKKAEKARKKEEEKLKKEEEKLKKQEEKKSKKSKEEDKKTKKLKDDAKIDDSKIVSSAAEEKTEQQFEIVQQEQKSDSSKNQDKIDDFSMMKSQEKDLPIAVSDEPILESTTKILETQNKVLEPKDNDVLKSEKILSMPVEVKVVNDDLEIEKKIPETEISMPANESMAEKEKPQKVPRTKKLSKKQSPKEDKKDVDRQNDEKLKKECEISVHHNESEKQLNIIPNEETSSSNNNLLEMEIVRGLSPEAKLNNKLFKRSLSIEENLTSTKPNLINDDRPTSGLKDNLPLIILPQKDKSATLDDRLLRRHKSPKLTSIDKLDFHHLDNVGCLDSSIKSYFDNFILSDNLSDLKDLSEKRRDYKERRSVSPTLSPYKMPNLSLTTSRPLKRHTISAKRTSPLYLSNLRSQLNTLNNAELSFLANQMKENKLKPPASNQFEMINKNVLNVLHYNTELSASTPCLSELMKPHPPIIQLPLTYVPSIINHHLSSRSRTSTIPHSKLSPIQMPLFDKFLFDSYLKTESMPSLSRTASVNRDYRRSLISNSIRATTRTSKYDIYRETGDIYYRDTIYELKRIENQLNRLKNQFDSLDNLSKMSTKSYLSKLASKRLLDDKISTTGRTYKYHCSVNVIKNDVEIKPTSSSDDLQQGESSRTKIYFSIYRQLGCNHVGSRDLAYKIKEHEDEFRAFCPPYVCVLCYYTVIAIHYLMKQGYDMNEAISMVRKKQDKENEDKWKHRSTILIDSRNRLNKLNLNYLPGRSSSPNLDKYDDRNYRSRNDYSYLSSSNVCHQATTHLNHHRHYSYERGHRQPPLSHREQYSNYKIISDDRPKSPSTLRLLDCSSPTSISRNACKSLYHSSYRTNYSTNRFQSDYMKSKSRIDPFLKDTNLRRAEIIWKSKNNFNY